MTKLFPKPVGNTAKVSLLLTIELLILNCSSVNEKLNCFSDKILLTTSLVKAAILTFIILFCCCYFLNWIYLVFQESHITLFTLYIFLKINESVVEYNRKQKCSVNFFKIDNKLNSPKWLQWPYGYKFGSISSFSREISTCVLITWSFFPC